MGRTRYLGLHRILWLFPPVFLAACSTSPYDPINQSPLIRRMDSFFTRGESDAITPPAGVRPQRQKVINPGEAP